MLLEAHLKREEPEHSLLRLGIVLSRLVVIVGEFLESKALVAIRSGMEARLLFWSCPGRLETWLQPHLICVGRLHRFYVIDSSLIVPSPAIPPANTTPDIACMVAIS